MLETVWWWIRGVRSWDDCGELCTRCGRYGFEHWAPLFCRRFRAKAS